MGEHVKPTSPVIPWATMPKRPSSLAMLGSLALPTVLQHWTGPVLHDEAGSPGMGVATARTAIEARKTATLENIFAGERVE